MARIKIIFPVILFLFTSCRKDDDSNFRNPILGEYNCKCFYSDYFPPGVGTSGSGSYEFVDSVHIEGNDYVVLGHLIPVDELVGSYYSSGSPLSNGWEIKFEKDSIFYKEGYSSPNFSTSETCFCSK